MIFFIGADCSFCISAKKLHTLKIKLGNTKTQLQANNPQNLKGDHISGDLLTATIWSWFAAAESNNRLSQKQANVIENPGLSYGLFHAVANPIYSWGVGRKVPPTCEHGHQPSAVPVHL